MNIVPQSALCKKNYQSENYNKLYVYNITINNNFISNISSNI